MLVAVDHDNLTGNEINLLRALYPNEKAMRLNKLISSTFTEKDGSSPSRVSFCAHGGFGSFGGHSAEDFAEVVVKNLLEGAKTNPGIKQSLKDIDLFGCMVGCDNGRDEVYTATVGRLVKERLSQNGFQPINFKSVTNRTLGHDSQFYTVYLSIPAPESNEKKFRVTGNATEDDYHKAATIRDDINKLMINKRRLEANNGGNGLTIEEELQKHFDDMDVTKHRRGEDPYLSKARQVLQYFIPYKGNPEIDKKIARIELLMDRYTKITDIKERGPKLFNQLSQCESVIQTDFEDPRKLVDKNPACNFSSHAGKFSQLKTRFQQVKDDTSPPSPSKFSMR